MSEKQNERTQQRLIKANNVQRRRFEKVADTTIHRAKSKNRDDIKHQKAVVYNGVVKKTMGHDLKVLMAIRSNVQEHKRAILKLQQDAEAVRARLVKRGISCSQNGYSNPLKHYIDPPAFDEKSEDVCIKVVGDPNVTLRLMECANNAPYAEYLKAIENLVMDEAAFDNACDSLRNRIWAVVSTEEIVEAIDQFKNIWL